MKSACLVTAAVHLLDWQSCGPTEAYSCAATALTADCNVSPVWGSLASPYKNATSGYFTESIIYSVFRFILIGLRVEYVGHSA